MTQYEIRPASWRVGPVGVESYNDAVTTVEITDECGGEFVRLIQTNMSQAGVVAINPEEWPALRSAIDHAVSLCRDNAVFDAAKEAANANP